MRIILLIVLASCFNNAFGQLPDPKSAVIDINKISARFLSDGTISFMPNSTSYDGWFEYPKGSGIQNIFGSLLWMRALDGAGNLKLAAGGYLNSYKDFFYGPVSAVYDTSFDARFNKVWKVSASEVDFHKNNFSASGYVMPDDIATWPAHGDVSKGQAANLAPYFDFNGDGFYTPLQGDYPLILGDEALYIIFNDDRLPHTVSGGGKLGTEIHLMVYGFDQPANPVVNSALFLSLKIYNRSASDLNDFKLSWFNDFDLGNFNNDNVGCDTALNTFYVYNAILPDGPNGTTLGHGNSRVVLGATFLNTPLVSFLTATGYVNPDPSTALSHDYMMNCKWSDGTLVFYQNDSSGNPVCHVYADDPCDSASWSYIYSGIVPGDKRALGTTGTFNFPAGAHLNLDLAYSFAIGDSTDSCLASGVTALTQTVPQLKQFYVDNNLGVLSPVLSQAQLNADQPQLFCYPNPAQHTLTIEWKHLPVQDNASIVMMDLMGRKVMEQKNSTVSKVALNISSLAEGVYTVVVSTRDGLIRERVVVK